MSITCLQSNLNNLDKSTPTNYQLVFSKIPTETSISAINPFVMNIHTAILPSVSLATEELRWQGNKTRHGLIPMEFDPWLVSFVIDSELANWKLLFKWMQFVNDNNKKIAEKHKDYSVDCSLVVTDNYNNLVLEVIFVSIWPSILGEVNFSHREGDVILESTINFNYDYFYIRGLDTRITISSSSSSTSSSSESSSSLSSSSSISSSSSVSSSSVSSSSNNP